MPFLFIYSNIFIQGKNIISLWIFCICVLFYDKNLHKKWKHIFKYNYHIIIIILCTVVTITKIEGTLDILDHTPMIYAFALIE